MEYVFAAQVGEGTRRPDRKSTRLNSSHANISYAVFCLEPKSTRLELQSRHYFVCRLLLVKDNNRNKTTDVLLWISIISPLQRTINTRVTTTATIASVRK